MLKDMLKALKVAMAEGNKKEEEKLLKRLQKVGMDAVTAKMLTTEI
jgi:hypothetical protein